MLFLKMRTENTRWSNKVKQREGWKKNWSWSVANENVKDMRKKIGIGKANTEAERWKQKGRTKSKQSSFKSYSIGISADHTITSLSCPLGPWSKDYYFDSNGLWIREEPQSINLFISSYIIQLCLPTATYTVYRI